MSSAAIPSTLSTTDWGLSFLELMLFLLMGSLGVARGESELSLTLSRSQCESPPWPSGRRPLRSTSGVELRWRFSLSTKSLWLRGRLSITSSTIRSDTWAAIVKLISLMRFRISVPAWSRRERCSTSCGNRCLLRQMSSISFRTFSSDMMVGH
uniref:Putative secreted protein n=1 Tax=Ixodes ricinus TaxID=34613 RepID=A0A6B0UWC6_IXORI